MNFTCFYIENEKLISQKCAGKHRSASGFFAQTISKNCKIVLKSLPQVHIDGDLQDFLTLDEGISTHERVSQDLIIEEILRARRDEENESGNENNEKKKRRKYPAHTY